MRACMHVFVSAYEKLTVPVLLFDSSLRKSPTSSASFLLSLASVTTCSCNAITELFKSWTSTLGRERWPQSLGGTLTVQTQPGYSDLVLCACVIITT